MSSYLRPTWCISLSVICVLWLTLYCVSWRLGIFVIENVRILVQNAKTDQSDNLKGLSQNHPSLTMSLLGSHSYLYAKSSTR